MKKLLVIFYLLITGSTHCNAEGYDIKLTVKQMAGKDIILGYYYEGKIYTADTTRLNASGVGNFRNSEKQLARGVYVLLFSANNYFDLIIGDHQKFSIKADTLNTIDNIHFENSPENEAFLDIQRFIMQQNQKNRQLQKEYSKDIKKGDPEIKKSYRRKAEKNEIESRNYLLDVISLYPGSALTTFIGLTLSPIIPDFSEEIPADTPNKELEIQRRSYYYNKKHYWDHTNFSDSTLIRTPVFRSKIDHYFNNILLQHPDTVYDACSQLIEKTRDNKTMFRYLTGYCFNFTADSKIMGMDKAFVNIAKRYYLSHNANWVSEDNLKKIEEEVIKLQYNLIGSTTQELKLPTMDGNWVSLHETKAPFTLLLFWESNCGHCKKQMPQIKTELSDRFKAYGFKVFAVHTQNKKDEWEKFVQEHDLFDFINCWDPNNQSNYRIYYNVFSTPVMYLLDKDKKIIAKKLDIEQLADMLQKEYKRIGIEVK